MTHLDLTSGARFGLESSTPSSFSLRFGRREMFVCRDSYVRRYRVNPVIECSAGIEPGHLEVLLFRRWLVVLSKARA
ncbi:hypothetical protein PMI16_04782 [Herbaspirillum sp. CF444]|uniref:hypothetical protein n=1 Tax=Herbaspirillum sp. CF444 TaxID=1144319 RepID=UPI000272409E|nr:hypothetical protein [Herbaspirillum sp. CF444]EJL81176.1 hypothetical protein PMI16_04782 [Herbaspirillum sp. CF444]